MRTFSKLLGFLFVLLLVSCSKDRDDEQHLQATSCDQWAVIDTEEYNNLPENPPFIQSLEINGDCLSITFSASGCDGSTWVVELLDSGAVAESLPPQRSLRLSLANQEDCLAVITKEVSFDLRELQVLDGNDVYLNIMGAEEPILYTY